MTEMNTSAEPGADGVRQSDHELRARWAAQVHSLLAVLDGLGGAALKLVYLNGMTQRQAADRLGVSESTVKAHVARGLHQLTALLLTSETPIT